MVRMKSISRLVRRPEFAAPIFVLLAAVILAGTFLALLRPDPAVAGALIAATIAVLGSTLSLVLGRYFDKERDTSLQLREKRIPEYEKFASFWLDVLYAEKLGKKPMSSDQMLKGFIDWTKPLIIWGSDEVIRQWGQLRVSYSSADSAKPASQEERAKIAKLFEFEELLLRLRRDVGYTDTTLKRGDILRLWMNDIDRYL